MWAKKHRQYEEDRCNSHYEFNNYDREDENDFECWNNGWDDDLRETFCINKNNMTVSDALKTDLDCGWGAASPVQLSKLIMFLFSITVFICSY